MNETEAIKIIIEHLKGLFPKTCPNCARRYHTLKEFYSNTQPVGSPISPDLAAIDLQPEHPQGAMAVSHCACGAPITLSSQGMPLFQYWALLLWARGEMQQRNLDTSEFLFELRLKVRDEVLAED